MGHFKAKHGFDAEKTKKCRSELQLGVKFSWGKSTS